MESLYDEAVEIIDYDCYFSYQDKKELIARLRTIPGIPRLVIYVSKADGRIGKKISLRIPSCPVGMGKTIKKPFIALSVEFIVGVIEDRLQFLGLVARGNNECSKY